MSSALCICVLFISLMQSVNGAQVINTTSLSTLIGLSPAFPSKFVSIQIFLNISLSFESNN